MHSQTPVCWLLAGLLFAAGCSTGQSQRPSDPAPTGEETAASNTSEPILYDTDQYAIHADRVTQGDIEVVAESRDKLVRRRDGETTTWEASGDVSGFPSYRSGQPLVDAMHRMSLEELLLSIRDDGALMAGEKWTGVWTRDISYAGLLSLALLAPDAMKKSLRAKVDSEHDRIIQDTGTGGSWPVSSDRVTWALAAWEVYKATGDDEWLKEAHGIIENSVRADLANVYDEEYQLFRGESSFLDWREQSYPDWMQPRDIYESLNLGTNAVYARTFQILAKMADRLDKPSKQWRNLANGVSESINDHLWQPDRGYYAQYLYGDHHLRKSPRAETLGSALAILFGIARENRAETLSESLPTLGWGVPCFYPQIPDIPPYHNDGIWPFVVSYWTWASAEAGNPAAVEHGLGSIYRAAALFLTNKENMVASTGKWEGTEVNSDRQLWSVAGNLASVYRVFFGMEMTPNGITLDPFVPEPYAGTRTIEKLPYRDATWTIEMTGYGTDIASVKRDGEEVDEARIPADLSGEHTLTIELANAATPDGEVNLVENQFSPKTPTVTLEDGALDWKEVDGAAEYAIVKNGKEVATQSETTYELSKPGAYAEYQVVAVAEDGTHSFASEPVTKAARVTRAAFAGDDSENEWVELTSETGDRVEVEVEVPKRGHYLIDVRYANGHGPINTDNKCAIRTLHVDGEAAGPIVMPQRGDGTWEDWGDSSDVERMLSAGKHTLSLVYEPEDRNMNGETNAARVKSVRLIHLGEK